MADKKTTEVKVEKTTVTEDTPEKTTAEKIGENVENALNESAARQGGRSGREGRA